MDIKKKIPVSSNWTKEEKALVVSAVELAITEIEEEIKEARKTVFYEAPCFAEWANKAALYSELLEVLKVYDSDFLELNRVNFEEFIEKK